MKVVLRDGKRGLVKMIPEVLDDLYHLAQLIRPGDRAKALTFRTPEIDDDVERRGKIEKKRMVLTLEVQTVEFHAFSDRLRIHGVITEGPQDLGLHHTLNIEADGRGDLTIIKPGGWRRHEHERLDRAEKEAGRPVSFILAIEEDEATLAEVLQHGVREVSTVTVSGRGKMFVQKGKDGFFDEVLLRVTSVRAPSAPLVVVGPGWTRERFVEFLKKSDPAQGNAVFTDGTGQAGMVGVHEAIKRGVLTRVVQDHAVARETELFERVLREIAKPNGLATYGAAEVPAAVKMGAVEVLIVLDRMVREGTADDVLAAAEQSGTEVHVISEGHEAGKGLAGLGGIAGVLRFRIER